MKQKEVVIMKVSKVTSLLSVWSKIEHHYEGIVKDVKKESVIESKASRI